MSAPPEVPASGSPRTSSTGLLLQKCVGLKEVTQIEADTILQHWLSTENMKMNERSKVLYDFVKKTYVDRAEPIWASMTAQQQVTMDYQSQQKQKAMEQQKIKQQQQQQAQAQAQAQAKQQQAIAQQQQAQRQQQQQAQRQQQLQQGASGGVPGAPAEPNVFDEMVKPGQGFSHVALPLDQSRGVVAQDIVHNSTTQAEAEAGKKIMYSQAQKVRDCVD